METCQVAVNFMRNLCYELLMPKLPNAMMYVPVDMQQYVIAGCREQDNS